MHVIPVIPLPFIGADPIAAPIDLVEDPSAHLDQTPHDVPRGPVQVTVVQPQMPFVNAAQHGAPEYVKSWDSYVGQEPMKAQLRVFIDDAEKRMAPLPHTLLASGMPGAGKTTLARLIAKEMGGRLTMLVPPFTPQTLYDAVLQMGDWEFLFIDEIHKLADHGPAAAENLLHLLEEKVLYLDDGVHELADFTVIGATTDADKLPETIIDRFAIKPFFQPYTLVDLVRIAKNFADFYDMDLLPETMVAIAKASRGTPRIVRELVVGARALQNSTGFMATPKQLLKFKELEPDGMTRQHRAYIMALYQFFGRERDNIWEYVAGEASLMTLLRENKAGISRLERFLVERGLVDRTPRGRRLTDRGIMRAQQYISHGERLNSE